MYELIIGWRYVYRGAKSRRAAWGFALSIALMAVGLLWFFNVAGAPALAVLTLFVGMLGTVTFGLLYFLSVFTTVSVLGVVLGVAALTFVMSMTSGMQQAFHDKVLGVNSHVIVRKNTNDFSEYREVDEIVRTIDPDVIASEPFQLVEMSATRGQGIVSTVLIKGVVPDRVNQVLEIGEMIAGDRDALKHKPAEGEPPPILIGKGIATKLKAKLGERLTLVAPLSNMDKETWTFTQEPPAQREFVVAGIFYAGFDEYDRRLMYVDLKEAQSLMGRGDEVLGIELRLKDVWRAEDIAAKIEEKLGGSPYYAQDWYALNKNLFTALFLQKLVITIILSLIVLVASFNMVSSLTMMVIDKTREIAILKSMGATSPGVAKVFLVVGGMIGGVGTLCGLGVGLVLCKVVDAYKYPLDPKVYFIDHLPVVISPVEIVAIAIIAMGISTIAAVAPSLAAARLNPLDGLRYD